MNIKKKVQGGRSYGNSVLFTDVTVKITSGKNGKTLSLSDENPYMGVMLSIPLETIEKELKKVLG